jgi:hypothetical protein
MADRVTVADVAADADARLAAAFDGPPWMPRPGGPPDTVTGGHVWAEVGGVTAATGTPGARGEAVAVRLVAAVRARTNTPERVDQIDALDRFVALAAGWPACTRHVMTVDALSVGGVDIPAVLAALTVLAPPC